MESVETFFLEAGADVSLKRVTTVIRESCFCRIRAKVPLVLKIKNRGVEPKSFTVELLKRSWVGSVETFFLEFFRKHFFINFLYLSAYV